MQRLKTRAQFVAAMAGSPVSRTAHFALQRLELDALGAPTTGLRAPPVAPAASCSIVATGPGSVRPKALFAVREPWIGALIPKRWAKRAVTRNTIKRQIHTVSLVFESRLPAAAHLVRLRAGFDRAGFPSATSGTLKQQLRSELHELFTRAVS